VPLLPLPAENPPSSPEVSFNPVDDGKGNQRHYNLKESIKDLMENLIDGFQS
jgi:hypothetical protein